MGDGPPANSPAQASPAAVTVGAGPESAVIAAAPSPANRLLTGPILPTLLGLAVPNVLAMLVAVLVGMAETFYIGVLGTAPLAAMAVVFPFVMLTQMLSSGAMGGGVSSAISRALGAADRGRANALAWHAVAIGLVVGVVYSSLLMLFARPLLTLLGAHGEVLELALTYARPLFASAFLIWLMNTLASVLRGSGNMKIPSLVIFSTALLQIALGGSLGLGLGPLPQWGLPGVAAGQILASAVAVGLFVGQLRQPGIRVRPTLAGGKPQAGLFGAILQVGALACLSPLQTIVAMLIFTGLIARLGVPALAGYGIGQRLEFMLIPIAFGIGVASVPMVGMAIGAGKVERARRVAWTAATVSGALLGLIGITLALVPDLWSQWFSADPEVRAVANRYLSLVGPAFPLFGFGLTLYFASQGSGKVLGPVLAATARLILIVGVGLWLASRQAGAEAFFWLVAAGMVLYGVATAWAVRRTRW